MRTPQNFETVKEREETDGAVLHRRRGKLWQTLLSQENGQTLVIVALCMVVLVAFLGLAIDVGQMRYHRRQLQMAVDAAAIAGALELSSCRGTPSCAALQTAAQDALTENGFTGSTLLANCAAGTGTRLEVTVDDPPCLIASDPNKGNGAIVEVMISQPQPTVFARVLGIQSLPRPDDVTVTLEFLRSEYDLVLVDCADPLDPINSAAIAASSQTYVIATPEVGAIRDLSRHIDELAQKVGGRRADDTNKVRAVINRYSSQFAVGLEEIEKAIRLPVSSGFRTALLTWCARPISANH